MKRTIFEFLAILLALAIATCVKADQCSPLRVFYGEKEWDYFGVGVTLAGDVNNDGYNDVIIGAGYLNGTENERGRVYVFSGLTGDTLYIFNGEFPRVYFGSAVDCAGDVNNDGYDDIIVGSSGYGPYYTGRAYVFSGQNGDTLHVFAGEAESNEFGKSVSSAGDVNNDGYDDLIIGAPGFDSFRGRAYVFSGQNGDTLFVYTGNTAEDNFGRRVSSAGDVNNDSYDDFLIHTPYSQTDFYSHVNVYSGQTGEILHIFTGELESDGFGDAFCSAGDVNNDGHDDLLVGAPVYWSNGVGGAFVGRVYVFSGLNWSTLFVLDGEELYDVFGHTVSSAGDVNHDGFDDFLVTAKDYGLENGGRVYVFSGRTGDTLQVITGESYYGHLGWSAGSGGDVDGDGFNDMIVGSWNYDTSEIYMFRATVYPIISCRGNRGDFNGDGIDAGMLDLIDLVDRIFRGGPRPSCFAEADVNSDGYHGNILDLTFLVDRIFRGGPVPGACY